MWVGLGGSRVRCRCSKECCIPIAKMTSLRGNGVLRCTTRLTSALLVVCAAIVLLPSRAMAQDHQQHKQNQQAHYDHYDHAVTAAPAKVQEQLDDFLESVGHVSTDVKATHDKKDVVDLGQSLRLVESKFSQLRRALLTELGVAAQKDPSGSAALHGHTKDLVRASSEMINRMGRVRDDVEGISHDVSQLNTVMSEIRQSIAKMDNDIALLHSGLLQAQADSSVVRDAQASMRNSLTNLHHQSKHIVSVQREHLFHVPKWYYVVLIEIFALFGFAAFKRYQSGIGRGSKFSKLG